jgi:hypothetical protein
MPRPALSLEGERRVGLAYCVAACLLLLLFVLQAGLESRIKSAVYDEPGDIAAGLSYIQNRDVEANLQHPPLIKELAGLSLWLAGIRLPATEDVSQLLKEPGGENLVGNAILQQYGADHVLFWARLPMLALSALLGMVIFLWGRQILGERAALCALFLYVFDPTMLAHSYLVTLDVGLAGFTLIFFWSLWNYLRSPSIARMAICGVALSFLLAAKYSAIFLLPVVLALVLSSVRWPIAESRPLFPRMRGYVGALAAFWTMCAIAVILIPLFYLSVGGWLRYASGMVRVNADHNTDHLAYLSGQLARRFSSYFAATWLLKEPIGTILLVISGVVALRLTKFPSLGKLFLFLPPVVLLLVHTLLADDIGIRYIIPAMPFAYLAAGAGAAWMLGHRIRLLRGAAIVLGAWIVLAATAVYPDHLSYFNEAACLTTHPEWTGLDGGSHCGPLWLDDSNVDWGQGLKQIKEWSEAQPTSDGAIRLAYFGMAPPSVYGIDSDRMLFEQLFDPLAPGRIAVSSHYVSRAPAAGRHYGLNGWQWLTKPPTAIVGHAWYVFDITK